MLPDLDRCYQLMAEHRMLDNIKDHSIVVAQIAEFLAASLNQKGDKFDLALVTAGALLHDIGKTICLDTDDNHALVGRDICLENGLSEIAPLVAEHVIIEDGFPERDISEKEIVYYADKRVNHDKIVSLKERLDYIIERYGRDDPKRHRAIKDNFHRCFLIEQRLFSGLDFSPEELETLVLREDCQFLSYR